VIVRFLDEFERVALMLAREPGLGALAGGDRASFPLHRFPYSVIYKPSGTGIRILVVRHQHRDPGHGEGRS
jgi:plasmid stabilization system protein ParE